jgi:hypothetical protein
VKILQSFVAILISFVIIDVAHALPSPTFRTVALRGQHAPGLPNDTSFSAFGTPSINSLGQVSFSGALTGPARDILTTNDTGLWTEGNGPLALLARENEPAAGGTAGQVYNDFDSIAPTISDSGDVAWRSTTRPPATILPSAAIWSGNVGTLKLHASVGSSAPGLPAGVTISNLNDLPVINSQGTVAYRATLTGTGVNNTNELTIWSTPGGIPQLLAREGDPAPDASANFSTLWSARLNDAGQVAISADLTSIDSGTNPESGWWLSNGNTLNLVVKDFSSVPGVPSGEFNVGQSARISLNSTGQVAFQALLRQSAIAGVDATNDSGVWSSGAGPLELLAREGSQPPGVVAGARFLRFDTPKLSDQGHTAFTALLNLDASLGITANNNSCLWSDAAGSLELVARGGEQAPGMPIGVLFSTFSAPRGAVDFAVNSDGHVAFLNSVFGGGTTTANDTALWAQDQNGLLRLIVREGDLFEVAPGDFRTISLITFQSQSAGGDGLARGFNDNYQLALRLFFTNNTSGVFVTSITVPEPGGLVLSLLMFPGLLVRCKQRG